MYISQVQLKPPQILIILGHLGHKIENRAQINCITCTAFFFFPYRFKTTLKRRWWSLFGRWEQKKQKENQVISWSWTWHSLGQKTLCRSVQVSHGAGDWKQLSAKLLSPGTFTRGTQGWNRAPDQLCILCLKFGGLFLIYSFVFQVFVFSKQKCFFPPPSKIYKKEGCLCNQIENSLKSPKLQIKHQFSIFESHCTIYYNVIHYSS